MLSHHQYKETSKTGILVTTQSATIRLWTIKAPILSAPQMDALKAAANLGLPFPEMFFGFNALCLEVEDRTATAASSDSNSAAFRFSFSAADALGSVDCSEEAMDAVKVAYAKEWTEKSEKLHGTIKQIPRPYDWTYTPKEYHGSLSGADAAAAAIPAFKTTTSKIDIELLKRSEPILFYDEIVLYEDELGDNGACMLTARVRVMKSCFLMLLRFFLRVDGVLFRIHDTRVFHAFDSRTVLRESSRRECSYDRVLGKISGGAFNVVSTVSTATTAATTSTISTTSTSMPPPNMLVSDGLTMRGARRTGSLHTLDRASAGATATPGATAASASAGVDLSVLNKADWVAAGMVDPLTIEATTEGVVVDGVHVTVVRDEFNF
ncbi:TIP41-like family-domain-containing protein [Chytriomyces cf. hyalinus JEL632]|nr:TIP41-like family-domain-containing protein [Chytriomyces cf. hyalinus JEL632]